MGLARLVLQSPCVDHYVQSVHSCPDSHVQNREAPVTFDGGCLTTYDVSYPSNLLDFVVGEGVFLHDFRRSL